MGGEKGDSGSVPIPATKAMFPFGGGEGEGGQEELSKEEDEGVNGNIVGGEGSWLQGARRRQRLLREVGPLLRQK